MFWRDGSQINLVPVTDRSFQYGDGCFTTMLTKSGSIQLWSQHVGRMQEALQRLKIGEIDWNSLKRELDSIASDAPLAGLKIHVSRGEGGRGYSPKVSSGPKVTVSRFEFPQSYRQFRENGIDLTVCDTPLGLNPLLAGLKHNNRLEQILAKEEVERTTFTDGLVLDINGNVIETTMANVFWIADGKVFTPSLDYAGVAGVMRGEIIKLLSAMNIPVEIASFTLKDVLAADEIFVSNCILGVAPVNKIKDAQFPPGTITRRIQEKLGQ